MEVSLAIEGLWLDRLGASILRILADEQHGKTELVSTTRGGIPALDLLEEPDICILCHT